MSWGRGKKLMMRHTSRKDIMMSPVCCRFRNTALDSPDIDVTAAKSDSWEPSNGPCRSNVSSWVGIQEIISEMGRITWLLCERVGRGALLTQHHFREEEKGKKKKKKKFTSRPWNIWTYTSRSETDNPFVRCFDVYTCPPWVAYD